MSTLYRGSCLCRTVCFEIDGFLPDAAHCHCSMCRKFHGAAFATFASVDRDKFRWTEGESSLKRYTATNGTTRTFCQHCGSSLTFANSAEPREVEIALATVDGDVPVVPNAHIFVGSGANWALPNDGLPRYTEGRGSALVGE